MLDSPFDFDTAPVLKEDCQIILKTVGAFCLLHELCYFWIVIDHMKMQVDIIFEFLKDIAVHNDRVWFAENRARYEEARAVFEDMVQQVLNRITAFDGTVSHLKVKDCT